MLEMHNKKLSNFDWPMNFLTDLPAGSSPYCASVIVIPEMARQAVKQPLNDMFTVNNTKYIMSRYIKK